MNPKKTATWASAALVAFVFVAVEISPGYAEEGPPPFTPPPTTPAPKKKTVAPPKTTVRRSSAPKQRTARRAAVPTETAPSGLPPVSETRYLADQVVVRFQLASPQRNLDALVARLNLRHLDGRTFALAGETLHRYEIVSDASVSETIAALEADPNVVYAQPNYLYALQQVTTGANASQYALDRLDLRAAQDITRGEKVRIAVIDSAIDISHPELARASVEIIDVADKDGDKPAAHGTSIAGVIVAGASLTGVAPGAELIGVTAFAPDSSGTARGNSWTIATAMDAAWRAKAQIFNLSFAGPPDPLIENGLKGATRRGIISFAAAGNEGPDADPLYPAAYDTTVGVTATDANDAIYTKANGGDYVELAAPGVDILTPAPGGAFAFSSGTSLATAHASGLAALVMSAAPGLSPARVEEMIAKSAKDLGAPGRDPVFGAGIPDALQLIRAVKDE